MPRLPNSLVAAALRAASWTIVLITAAAGTFQTLYPDRLAGPSVGGAVAFVLAVLAWPLAFGPLLVAFAAAVRRRWRLAAAGLAVGVGLWLALVHAPAASVDRPATGGTFRVVTANLARGDHTAGLLAEAARLRPDVLVLQEVTQEQADTLTPALADRLPFAVVHPYDGHEGYGVWSAFPVAELTPEIPPGLHDEVRAYRLGTPAGEVTLLNVHPTSPRDADRLAENRWETGRLRDLVGRLPGPLVLAGDLNQPPASPGRRALRRAGLAEATRLAGVGQPATWPAALPVVNVDTILLSPGLTATAAGTGAATESDHLPVWADVAFSLK